MTAPIVAFIESRLREREQPAAAEQRLVKLEFARPGTIVTYQRVRISRTPNGRTSTLHAGGAPSPAEVLAMVARDAPCWRSTARTTRTQTSQTATNVSAPTPARRCGYSRPSMPATPRTTPTGSRSPDQ